MTVKLDCAILNTKQALLGKFAGIFAEMYDLNYDAWADAATFCKDDMIWEFVNLQNYEDVETLCTILQDITTQNPHITVVKC